VQGGKGLAFWGWSCLIGRIFFFPVAFIFFRGRPPQKKKTEEQGAVVTEGKEEPKGEGQGGEGLGLLATGLAIGRFFQQPAAFYFLAPNIGGGGREKQGAKARGRPWGFWPRSRSRPIGCCFLLIFFLGMFKVGVWHRRSPAGKGE
jgi:hypothetical protein